MIILRILNHLQPQYKYELFHVYVTLLHCTGKYELNKLASLQCVASYASSVGRASHRYRGGHGFESR